MLGVIISEYSLAIGIGKKKKKNTPDEQIPK